MSAQEPLANPSRRPWSVALSEPESWISIAKWGAITGVGYYVIANFMVVIVNALTGNTGNVTTNLVFALPSCVSIFALIFGLYTAGYKAANERTHVAPGFISTIFMLVLVQVLDRIFTATLHGQSPTNSNSVGVAIVGFVLDLAIALGTGYMGAFYGVKNKLKAVARAS